MLLMANKKSLGGSTDFYTNSLQGELKFNCKKIKQGWSILKYVWGGNFFHFTYMNMFRVVFEMILTIYNKALFDTKFAQSYSIEQITFWLSSTLY